MYLQSILQLSNNRALRDESKQLALDGVGERYDEGQEYSHLEHQKEEHLYKSVSLVHQYGQGLEA